MLPKLLDSRLQTLLSSDYDDVIQAFLNERKGSFRINILKSSSEEVLNEFKEKGIIVKKFPDFEKGNIQIYTFDRDQEYAIKGTKVFYEGKIYLQSISSMLPVLALDPQKGESILDICAAPGSKTTMMAMIMENKGQITALEQNQIRYDKLLYNVKLQGASIVEGVKIDARLFLSSQAEVIAEVERSLHSVLVDSSGDDILFDRILLDAPCSAEGRIDIKNEKSYGFWSLENIKKKSDLQYELLTLAVGKLKKGGVLVYSTCTLAPEENEGVISRILTENSDIRIESIDIGLSDKSWWKEGITTFGSQKYSEEMKTAVRILPSEETEGFFMAKILKK